MEMWQFEPQHTTVLAELHALRAQGLDILTELIFDSDLQKVAERALAEADRQGKVTDTYRLASAAHHASDLLERLNRAMWLVLEYERHEFNGIASGGQPIQEQADVLVTQLRAMAATLLETPDTGEEADDE
jgi:hypothetical protein